MSNNQMSNHADNHVNGNGHRHVPDAEYRALPSNVGILAMEVYFPMQYVEQNKLEAFDKVSAGKYTIGLGQSKMGFCLDNEDVNSICLTVLNNLMENYSIKPEEIGRLDVGTETIIDKSKSVKSTLMTLFEKSGNTDIEGVDNLNACFGGTAAIFNAINWVESSYWDGRYAAVVMGDLAVYAKGNARPTGGAGAIAFLIGPNAPLVFERGMRSVHIANSYDFYKPVLDSEYPIVDGKLSVVCYLDALDRCYQNYKRKYSNLMMTRSESTTKSPKAIVSDFNNNCLMLNNNSTKHLDQNEANDSHHQSNHHSNHNNHNHHQQQSQQSPQPRANHNSSATASFSLDSAHAFVFHAPYCKLVQKSLARLLWNDYLANEKQIPSLDKFKQLSREETLSDKQLERELMQISETYFKTKTEPTLTLAKEVGNMYTPSLYACLVSYLLNYSSAEQLRDKRVCIFSYGSGLASAMFSLLITDDNSERFTLDRILANLHKAKRRLAEGRVEVEPALYDAYLQVREKTHKNPSRECCSDTNTIYPGSWYLKSIDENYRRVYGRVPPVSEAGLNVASIREAILKQLREIQPVS